MQEGFRNATSCRGLVLIDRPSHLVVTVHFDRDLPFAHVYVRELDVQGLGLKADNV